MVLKIANILVFIIYIAFFVSECYSVPCDKQSSVIVTEPKFINGNIMENDTILYRKGEYYFDDKNNTRGCICKIKRCIRKCCDLDQYFSEDSNACVDTDDIFDIKKIPFFKNNKDGTIPYEKYALIYGVPCKTYYGTEFTITKSGLLREPGYANNVYYYNNINNYCVDIVKSGNESSFFGLVCLPDSDSSYYSALVYPGLYEKTREFLIAVSLIFFILMFFAFAVTPELKSLRGLCLIIQTIGLFFVYSTIVITRPSLLHEFLGTAFGFSYFAAAFWTSVILVDLRQSFRCVASAENKNINSGKMTNIKKFVIYSVISWGASLLLLIIHIIINHYCKYLNKDGSLDKDTASVKTGVWLFFYGPVVIVLFVNIFLLIDISRKRKEINKTTLLNDKDYTREKKEDYVRFTMFEKIFVTMGITWLIEIIGFTFVNKLDFWCEGPILLLNNLRALSAFIFVVMESNVRNAALHKPA